MASATVTDQAGAPEALGKLVRRLRRRLGLSQVKLAELSGCSRRWVLDLEKGLVVDIRLSDCRRLASALQVDGRSLVEHALATEARHADASGDLPPARRPSAGRVPAIGAAADLADPERLRDCCARPELIDDRLIDEMQQDLDRCVGPLWDGPPGRLAPQLTTRLATLRFLLGACRRPPLARRLLRLVAETASLAGVTALHLDNRGDARAHLQLAEVLALQAGEAHLVAHALINRRALFSSVPYGGQGGHAPTALALLDQAERTIGRRAPPLLQAWLYASRAEEQSVLGDEVAARHDLERASRAIDQSDQPAHSPFFSIWNPSRLTGFRGSCALLLGRFHEAATNLEDALRRTSPAVVTQYCDILTDLAASYAAQGHVDHAAVLLDRSLTMTSGAAMNIELQRILGVRRRCIPRSAHAPAVRLLDERLQHLASWADIQRCPSSLALGGVHPLDFGRAASDSEGSTDEVRRQTLVELTHLGGP